MEKDLISIMDVKDEINDILELAASQKASWKKGKRDEPLKNLSLGMIFEKPSTRTRVSFEVGMTQFGGHSLYLSPNDLQMGRGETIADTAKVLSRFVDGIMYRAFDYRVMRELADNATVPVINGLDDLEHPCQILADLLTIKEHKGKLRNLRLVYLGDGNNVCNSLLFGCATVGMDIIACVPEGYEPDAGILEKAKGLATKYKTLVEVSHEPQAAVKGADVLYTDVWVSMGEDDEKGEKERKFGPFQINKALVDGAKPDCIVLHCLPAHRGVEITDEVIDGKNSVVFDQAENRLHAQKAIMYLLMKKE